MTGTCEERLGRIEVRTDRIEEDLGIMQGDTKALRQEVGVLHDDVSKLTFAAKVRERLVWIVIVAIAGVLARYLPEVWQ